ncbi:MAG: glycosyltransferase family 4 protein [Actinomycetia bacterium]|nr:glycosyltransferase family 4 protein [Actinomycetes bacterium]
MHVVMMLNGAAIHDTRVMREAAWLARAGLTVTILARSPSGTVEIRSVAGARLLRVPLPNDVALHELAAVMRRRYLGLTGGDALRRSLAEARHDADRHRYARAGRITRRALRARAVANDWVEQRRTRTVERLQDRWRAYDEFMQDIRLGARWRTDLGGQVDDLELAYGPLLDWLAPDAIHAHDVHVLGVAVQAKERARAQGRDVAVVYDAHEYVRGMSQFGRSSARRIAAWANLEDEYIGQADAVMTVSPHLARFMRRDHDLEQTPSVILNVPVPGEGDDGPSDTVRERVGLPGDVPLAVYSGVLRGVRGVETVIEALSNVPDLHLAILSVPNATTPGALEVRAHAEKLGVDDRVHVCDAVPVAHVAGFLSSADIGVIPIKGGWTSYDFCLPNKFFECLAAGLPLVTSNLPTMAELVGAEGLGETFPAGDAAALATAMQRVLGDLERYRARVADSQIREEAHWRNQEAAFKAIYEGVLGVDLGSARRDERPLVLKEEDETAAWLSDSVRLWLGPTNHEGWASARADAARTTFPDLTVEVTHINRRRRHAAADVAPSRETYNGSSWQALRRLQLSEQPTIIVWEDGRPLCGEYASATCLDEARMVKRMGVPSLVWLHVPPARHVEAVLDDLRRLGVTVASGHPELCQSDDIVYAESPDDLIAGLVRRAGTADTSTSTHSTASHTDTDTDTGINSNSSDSA